MTIQRNEIPLYRILHCLENSGLNKFSDVNKVDQSDTAHKLLDKFKIYEIMFQVRDRIDWLEWLRYSVTEYLFLPMWYNRQPYINNFVADNAQSKILAMARTRQLRVKPSESVFLFIILPI